MNLFVENLNLKTFLLILKNFTNIKKIYLLDTYRYQNIYLFILNYFFKVSACELEYKLLDVVGEDGELIVFRINRKVLFEFQNKIEQSIFYKSCSSSNKNSFLNTYKLRSIIGNGYRDKQSITRAIYLIEVVKWFKAKSNLKTIKIIMNERPWFYLLQEYLANTDITLLNNKYKPKKNFKNFLNSYLSKNILFHNFIFNLKLLKLKQIKISFQKNKKNKKLFLIRRGDVNFHHNGYNSDFFWLINSKFKKNNIVYGDFNKVIPKNEISIINKNGIELITGPIFLQNYTKSINQKNKQKKHDLEITSIKNSVNLYKKYYCQWSSIFNKYNIKLTFDWQRFSVDHLAMNSALKDQGGISALWQLSFIGMPTWGCQSKSDIFFTYSKVSANMEKKNKSIAKHFIISGLPRDYSNNYLISDAKKIRKKLQENGVKKIVSVFDGNSSTTDLRWHSGNEIQKENYEFILQAMMSNENLGVIFKPKSPQTLKNRLGKTYDFLIEAEETGRCIILKDTSEYHSPTPPILAGLASDICVHCDLSSGSAALECASANKNVLLIDREGAPYSILNELKNGQSIFKNWRDTIDAIDNYDVRDKNSKIGDWSKLIDKLDPFQDGLSANRIGTYLEWIMEGLNTGQKADIILENAAERYCKKWGYDKIIT